MSRELLQQALDALESLQDGCTDSDDGTVEAITVWCPELIDALRAALAAPQPEPVALCDALRWSGAKESHGAMMFSPEQLRKFYEFASAPPAAPAPAVPTISPLALRALRMADMALASWENGYAFDSHGPGREAQRLVTDALALSAAPAAPVDPSEIEHPTNRYLFKQMLTKHGIELGIPIADALRLLHATPVVREPLTEEWIAQFFMQLPLPYDEVESIVRHVEQAHGIGGGGK